MKRYEDFIEVNFSYNGELGKLQEQTKANFQFASKLLIGEIISHDEYIELKERICNYFKSEIENVSNNFMNYII